MGVNLSNISLKSVSIGNAPAGPTDPDFGSVELLLHLDGTNGSTTIIDNSQNNFGVGVSDGAVLSTANAMFGTAGGNFTANNDSRLVTPTSAALRLVGDFTVEFWWKPSLVQSSTYFFGCLNSSHCWFNLNSSSFIEFYALGNQYTSTTVPVSGTWYHLATSRTAGVMRYFINGVQQGGTQINSTNMTNNAYWTVGAAPQLAGAGTGGRCYIDEVRITIGAGRYTSNFTPTGPFPNS